jgi:hypothetical protein
VYRFPYLRETTWALRTPRINFMNARGLGFPREAVHILQELQSICKQLHAPNAALASKQTRTPAVGCVRATRKRVSGRITKEPGNEREPLCSQISPLSFAWANLQESVCVSPPQTYATCSSPVPRIAAEARRSSIHTHTARSIKVLPHSPD